MRRWRFRRLRRLGLNVAIGRCYCKNIFAFGAADLDTLSFDFIIRDPIFCMAMFALNDQVFISLSGLPC
jgi:hypothetical protein